MTDTPPSKKLGPCPIPRCALEWFLALASCIMGVSFILSPVGLQLRSYLSDLPPSAIHIIPLSWGFLLFMAGFAQAVSLLMARVPQRWAASAALVVWVIITVMVIHAGLLLLAAPCIAILLGEFYVATMLKL